MSDIVTHREHHPASSLLLWFITPRAFSIVSCTKSYLLDGPSSTFMFIIWGIRSQFVSRPLSLRTYEGEEHTLSRQAQVQFLSCAFHSHAIDPLWKSKDSVHR